MVNQKLIQDKLHYMGLTENDKFDVSWGISFTHYPILNPNTLMSVARGFNLEECINLIWEFIRDNEKMGKLLSCVGFELTHVDPNRGTIRYVMLTNHLVEYNSEFKKYSNPDVHLNHFIYLTDFPVEPIKQKHRGWEGL